MSRNTLIRLILWGVFSTALTSRTAIVGAPVSELIPNSQVINSSVAESEPVLKPTVIVDIDSMDEASRAEVVASILKLSKRGSGETVTVQLGDTLFGIINEQYRFYDSQYPLTAQAIAVQVMDDNGLQQATDLKAGQLLSLRALPSRPYSKGANPNLGQVFNIQTGGIQPLDVSQIDLPFPPPPTTDVPTGKTWILNHISIEDVRTFLQGLSDKVRHSVTNKSLYIGPSTEIATLHLVSMPVPCSQMASTAAFTSLTSDITLDPATAGKFYILDTFTSHSGQPCSHGQMVKAVADMVLDQIGGASLKQNITPIDLEFFANKQQAKTYVDKFAHSLTQSNEIQVKKFFTALANTAAPQVNNDQIAVPLLYLLALNYSLLTAQDTSVISTSFWAWYDGFSWLPPEYLPESNVNLVTAVLDEDGTFIEDPLYIKREPIHTYFNIQEKYGVALVGAEKSAGIPFGMASKNGSGVTFIGKGFGWGAAGTCLGSNGGTSFATPQIAAELFLAKAYWNTNNIKVDAKEARLRLMLASDLSASYVGKYASAGIPVVSRLLVTSGAFVVDSAGKNQIAEVSASSSIAYTDGAATPSLLFGRGGSPYFAGLQVVNGVTYIFSTGDMKWKQVASTALHITIQLEGNKVVVNSSKEFADLYKALLVF